MAAQTSLVSATFKLEANEGSTANIEVFNLVTEKSVISDKNGEFTLAVSVDDLLLISNRNFEIKRYLIEATDLQKEKISVMLISKAIQLDETVVTSTSHINARALGIISPNTPIYTPAERQLITAGDLHATDFLGLIFGGGMALDPVFNAINGKTAALKKYIAFESKETRMDKYKDAFGVEFFENQLRIPSSHLRGFLFYVADNGKLQHAFASGDRNMAKFLLSQQAVNYKKIHIGE